MKHERIEPEVVHTFTLTERECIQLYESLGNAFLDGVVADLYKALGNRNVDKDW